MDIDKQTGRRVNRTQIYTDRNGNTQRNNQTQVDIQTNAHR